MRVRNKPWADAELASNQHVINKLSIDKLDSVFINNNPVHIEIGAGKGRFITSMAQLNPNINYVGIEKQKTVCAIAAKKIPLLKLENIKMLCDDVSNIDELFTGEQISMIYINFCDPWPKSRYGKRRLTHRNFLRKYKSILKEKGNIVFKTDNKQLFHFSLNEFINEGWKIKSVSLDLHKELETDNIMTEYEQKFSELGMNIYRIITEV